MHYLLSYSLLKQHFLRRVAPGELEDVLAYVWRIGGVDAQVKQVQEPMN